ncbi:type II secretion system protein GspM [Glycocaulis abyssi]|uniref:Type II secretion system protein GspM n=1 Tax=Glycocaulis abyssi TaxID=1433403 RepID=A0ABV9NC78_9PROT
MNEALQSRWQRLSVREQGLLIIAAALVTACLVWLAAFQPVLNWRDSARAAYTAAADDYRQIGAGAARLAALTASGEDTALEREPVRSVVAGSASRAGIVLSRVLPDDAGRLNVWIDGVDGPRLMGWLETLSRDHGVIVVRAGIEQAGQGAQVRAQLLLARSGA